MAMVLVPATSACIGLRKNSLLLPCMHYIAKFSARTSPWQLPRLLMPLALLGMLSAGCGHSAAPAAAPPVAVHEPEPEPSAQLPNQPSVVAVVRHFTGLLAQGSPLSTPAARQFAGQMPQSQPADNADPGAGVFLFYEMTTYVVEVLLDRQQRVVDLHIRAPRAPEDPHRTVLNVPQPWPRFVRLGELRRAFGPETIDSRLPDQVFFRYQPAASAPKSVIIGAGLTDYQRSDSSQVMGIGLGVHYGPIIGQ